jgi:hypothetical protein
MSAGVYWFRITNGEYFNRTVTYLPDGVNPADLTGYSADFYIDLNNSELIHVSSPSDITLGGTAGTVKTVIAASVFAGVQDFSEASYRLMLTPPSGIIFCLLSGQFTKEGESS